MAMNAHLRGVRPLRRRTSRGLGKTSEGREEREIPDRELPARPAFRDGLTGACPLALGTRERWLSPWAGRAWCPHEEPQSPFVELSASNRAIPGRESRFTAT
jgi:hypothetical protein